MLVTDEQRFSWPTRADVRTRLTNAYALARTCQWARTSTTAVKIRRRMTSRASRRTTWTLRIMLVKICAPSNAWKRACAFTWSTRHIHQPPVVLSSSTKRCPLILIFLPGLYMNSFRFRFIQSQLHFREKMTAMQASSAFCGHSQRFGANDAWTSVYVRRPARRYTSKEQVHLITFLFILYIYTVFAWDDLRTFEFAARMRAAIVSSSIATVFDRQDFTGRVKLFIEFFFIPANRSTVQLIFIRSSIIVRLKINGWRSSTFVLRFSLHSLIFYIDQIATHKETTNFARGAYEGCEYW